jgi:hypothetical protein
MEADWAAAYLLHPVPIAFGLGLVLLVILVTTSANPKPPALSRKQLLVGYIGIFLGCVIASAWDSYVSPEDALRIWKVPRENYWNAIFHAFSTQLVLLSYASLIGATLVGVPVVSALARRGLATVPYVVGVSVAISLAFTGALVLLDAPSPGAHFVQMAPYFVGLHLLLSLGFCVGARLQWGLKQEPGPARPAG